MMGGGGTNEVFYNFNPQKVTKLKVKIEKSGNYGLGYVNGDISEDKPTIIDWGNGGKSILKAPINNNTQLNDYVTYYKPGEYEISIDGWYNHFKCYDYRTEKSIITQISNVLTEIIQVSSLITSFSSTFKDCTALSSIPTRLFDNNINVTSFESAFYGCSSLKGETPYTLSSDGKKIKLWDRDGTNGFVKPTETSMAFLGCVTLTDFIKIPNNWKY